MAVQPNSDITAADGALITVQAMAWKGTPYQLVGPGSVVGHGGDCSGSTWRIYGAAGFAYDYQATGTFPDYVVRKKRFRELSPGEAMQEGDLLYWSNHMAIYSGFANDTPDAATDRVNTAGRHWTQNNDMWTASKPGGPVYGPAKMSYFKPDRPRIFRYQK